MPTTPPPFTSADQEARTQRHLEVLDILIAHGIDIATRLYQQSTTPSDLCSALAAPGIAVPFITPDVIAALAQINQTIRRAILVSHKLAEPRPLAHPTRVDAQPSAQPDRTQPDTVRPGSADRVYSPDLEDRIDDRPVPELIDALARDLGLESVDGVLQTTSPALAGHHAEPHLEALPAPVQIATLRTGRPEPDGDATATATATANVNVSAMDLGAKPEPRPPKR